MSGLRGIGNPVDGPVRISQPCCTLHVDKEDVDLRLCPSDFQSSASQETLVDRTTIRIGVNLAVRQPTKRIVVRQRGGTIAFIEVDQIVGAPIEGKAIVFVRYRRNQNLRLIESSNETRAAIRPADSKRSTVGLEEGPGIGCRRRFLPPRSPEQRKKVLCGKAEGASPIRFDVNDLPPACFH